MDEWIRMGDLERIRRPRRTGDDREKGRRRGGDEDRADEEEHTPAEGDERDRPNGRQRALPPGKGTNLDVDT